MLLPALLLTTAVQAQGTDAALAAVRSEALQLIRDQRQALNAERASRFFVAARLEKAWLREARIQIDALPQREYHFNEDESRALNAGGLHPMFAVELAPGAHRVRATLIVREAGSTPHARRVAVQFDNTLELPAAASVELRVEQGGIFSGSSGTLQLIDRSLARQRAADYLDASDRPLAAALERDSLALTPARPAMPGTLVAASQRYNQAIARLSSDPVAALSVLEALAGEKPVDAAGWALRDRANLSLAYERLQRGDPDGARKAFSEVRSPGPYDSAATLGLGWSQMLPAGAAATRHTPLALRARTGDELAQLRRQAPFAELDSVASGRRAEELRRAVVPWTELIGRDPLDPAVQEGMLALPYALEHLGAYEQARQRYEQSIARLEAALAQLRSAHRQVDDGQLLAALARRDGDASNGWSRLLVTQRDDGEAVALRALAAAPEVSAALRDYREVLMVEIEAQPLWQAPADAALAPRINALRARLQPLLGATSNQLRAALHAELTRLEAQAGRYLAEAHFALARHYDDAVAEAAP